MNLSQALAEGLQIAELESLALHRYGYPGQLSDRRALAQWLKDNPQCDIEVSEIARHLGKKKLRPEQNEFRAALFHAYDGKCAVTGATTAPVLEAAHLPGRSHELGHNQARDGILLRADLHKLMDAKPPMLSLVRQNNDIVVRIHKDAIPDYRELDGRKIRLPERVLDRPAI